MRDDADSPGWQTRIDALANHPRRTLEVRVGPLADDEADEFIALKDAEGTIIPATRCEVRTRAEGNPLYLEELTRTVLDTVNRQGLGGASQQLAPGDLPAALESLLLAR